MWPWNLAQISPIPTGWNVMTFRITWHFLSRLRYAWHLWFRGKCLGEDWVHCQVYVWIMLVCANTFLLLFMKCSHQEAACWFVGSDFEFSSRLCDLCHFFVFVFWSDSFKRQEGEVFSLVCFSVSLRPRRSRFFYWLIQSQDYKPFSFCVCLFVCRSCIHNIYIHTLWTYF